MLLELLVVLLWIWYGILWFVGLLGWYTARRRYRNRPRSPLRTSPAAEVPGVSILRPLKGLDANLFENLESCLVQDYPKFEVIFAVDDPYDQALGVVREVMAKYPTANAKIVISQEHVGVNPKVNNLMRPYHVALHDILWVIDSNVQVAADAMGRAVHALLQNDSPGHNHARRIGLVHHVPFASALERPFGSQLEEAFLNTNHAKMYLALNALAIDSCVIGKSNMYRRSDVEKLTGNLKPQNRQLDQETGTKGLAAFGRFLAEDNMIAAGLWHELGLRHDLSCDIALNTIGNMSFSAYFWRRVRWVRVRKYMAFTATVLEPFTESVVVGLLVAWTFKRTFRLPVLIFLLCHLLLWLVIDLDVYKSLAGHTVPPSIRLSFLRAWICRELLALPIWAYAIVGNEVTWRGTRYRVLSNSEAKRVDSFHKRSWWRRATPLEEIEEAGQPLVEGTT